jgi:hypothetical protein
MPARAEHCYDPLHITLLGVAMRSKDSGNTGLAVLGILGAMTGGYLGYLWIGSGSTLLILGAVVALIAGVAMAAVGFHPD